MQPLSILLLGTQMATGGAQKVLLDQARWLHEHGQHVQVVFFYDKENFHEKWQEISNFPVIDLHAFQQEAGIFINTFALLSGMLRLWKLIYRENINVIETFTHDSNILALPFAWLAGVKVRIATHHGVIDGFPFWKEKLHSWIINSGIANIIVAVSERTRQNALKEGIKAERIQVIQNGIAPISIEGVNRFEVRKEAGFGINDPLLLSVGRLVYQKAHEILVSAMPSILKVFPSVKLGICGDGILYSNLEEQIQFLNLSNSVKLLGKRDDVLRFLAITDIFVLPSRWEGLPIALLEAMSVGLPVVATNVEGVDEVIVHGENGLLVPVEDANALSQAVLQLLQHPSLIKDMGIATKKRLQKLYSIDRMGERYLSLMREIALR